MTITIELDDQNYASLLEQARNQGRSLEEFAVQVLIAEVNGTSSQHDDTFLNAMEATFQDNHELYSRLAK